MDVSDALQVTITDSPNRPPEVGAGADQEVAEGATVALSGTASDDDPEDDMTYEWAHNSALPITLGDDSALDTSFAAPSVDSNTAVQFTLTVSDGIASVSDSMLVTITPLESEPEPRDNNDPVTNDLGTNRSPAVVTDDSDVVRQGRGGDSSRQSLRYLPAIDLSSIIHSGIVPIPSDILQTAIAFDPSVTIRPSYNWLGLDPPVIINDHGYLLAGPVNTLEPQVIMEGESASIVFTVYDFFDIESLAVYLAPHGSDTRISDNATWFLYNGGVPITADPWNLIADVDVRIEDDAYRQTKKRVNLDVEFENAVGTIDMEIRIWTVDSRSTTVQVLNAMEILADPDRVALEPEPPSDQKPPVSPTAALRMWAGLGPVTIGDAGLLAALGLDYPDAEIPPWVKTGLVPLAINNGIAVDEFTTALEYVLGAIRDGGTRDAAGSQPADPDATAPTVTSIEMSDPAEESTSETTLAFGVAFSEDVTGVDAGDFALSPDSGSGPGQFTRTRMPGLAIPDNAAAVSDAITVPGPGTATSVTVSVDIAHPYIDDLTVELVAPDGAARTLHDRSGGNADDIVRTYTPDFGGAGIAGDWTLRASDGAPGDAGTLNGWTLTIGHDGAGGSVTGLAGSGSRYLVTVSAAQGGTYNLDVVRDSGITDAAGNPLADAAPTGADHTYTVVADTTAPTVTSIERSDPAEESTSGQTLVFGVTFGEDVTGVDAGDFALSPDGGFGQFTRTSTPGLAIPDNAAAVSDAITVPGFGTATSVSVSVDIEHPFIGDLTVELVAPDGTARTLHGRSGGLADDIVRTYTPDFGGAGIAGDWTLRASDGASGDTGTLNGWTLTIGHDGAGGSVTGLTGSGSQYLVTVSATRNGTYNLDVIRDSGITDAAGNPLAGAAPTGADHTYTVIADTTAPTVTSIERGDPAEESTSGQTLVFEVTFSEGVTGVDAGDFALSPDSGSGPGQFTQTSTPALAIPDNAAAISDAITVPGPGTATSVSVSVDIAHPYIDDLVVELVAPDGTARTLHGRSGGLADDIVRTYTPDFGGAGIAGDWALRVSDGASGDAGTLNGWTLTVGHDGAGGSVTGLAGSGSRYLVTVSAPREGTYDLYVIRDSGITDVVGNPLAGAAGAVPYQGE